MINKQFAFDMIVFMQNDAGCYTGEGCDVLVKIFITIGNGYFLCAGNIFADLWYAEASLVIRPVLTQLLHHMCIYKNLFNARTIGIILFCPILFVHIGENL